MLVNFCSIDELTAAKDSLEELGKNYPELFKKFLHMIHLTRALQFKYQYMGCLFMDEDPSEYAPISVPESVLNLYLSELQKLKDDVNSGELKEVFARFSNHEYGRICLLLLGSKLESLVGPDVIR